MNKTEEFEPVQLDQDYWEYINRYNHVGTKIKELEKEREEIKLLLQEAMDFKPIAFCGNQKLSLLEQTRETVDTKSLKAAFPEAYDECKKETKFFTLRISVIS